MFKLIVFQGPSGSGKSTLQTELGLTKIISWTSREPRTGEENGIHYNFVTISTLEKMKVNGELLETTEYQGNLYATSIESITNITDPPHSIILDIAGSRSLKGNLSDSILVIGVYASYEDCQNRLIKDRNYDEVIKRLQTYHEECEQLKECDIVINNSISYEKQSNTIIKLLRNGLRNGV